MARRARTGCDSLGGCGPRRPCTVYTFTTTTLRNDVYAFVFNPRGLMAGIGLQGSKITRIQR